jgi:hypothetical protein
MRPIWQGQTPARDCWPHSVPLEQLLGFLNLIVDRGQRRTPIGGIQEKPAAKRYRCEPVSGGRGKGFRLPPPERVKLVVGGNAHDVREPVRHGEERRDGGNVPNIVLGEPHRFERGEIGFVDLRTARRDL